MQAQIPKKQLLQFHAKISLVNENIKARMAGAREPV